MRGGASPIDMVEVTAADRAAAPVRGGGNPSARLWRAPPLSGEALCAETLKGSLRLRNREVALATLGFTQRLNPKPFREAD